MNKKIERKWCAALRGGTWKQLKGQYNDGDLGRCALGLLADIVKPTMGDNYPGLSKWLVDNIPTEQSNTVASMNDSGVSFLEIADWIESQAGLT